MAQLPTQNRPVALPLGSKHTEPLKACLKAPTRLNTTTYEEEPLPWKAPATAHQKTRDEARAEAASLRGGLDQSAPEVIIHAWLSKLGPMVAGNNADGDAAIKLAMYTPRLTDYPYACFTEQSLTAAARSFEFFPDFKKLCDFLDAERGRLRETMRRCEIIASGEVQDVKRETPYQKPTDEEKQWVSQFVSGAMKQAQTAPQDPDFLWKARLSEFRRYGKWYESAGPRPGEPGCLVPQHLMFLAS